MPFEVELISNIDDDSGVSVPIPTCADETVKQKNITAKIFN